MGGTLSDFSGSIRRLSGGATFTVTRFTAGQAFVNGKLSTPASTPLPIVAMIQPATGKDLQLLPEAMRSSQVLAIWTSTPLLTVDEATQQLPDEISYHGVLFQVQRVEPWGDLGNYIKALARRKG